MPLSVSLGKVKMTVLLPLFVKLPVMFLLVALCMRVNIVGGTFRFRPAVPPSWKTAVILVTSLAIFGVLAVGRSVVSSSRLILTTVGFARLTMTVR
ncbi:MAG: hypothetical protein BWY66_02765 [bacterium ADurb.Bin374]|nr:MAG: hypothetical protein BWY66_02765 [bacterium ADurb.Bin374]